MRGGGRGRVRIYGFRAPAFGRLYRVGFAAHQSASHLYRHPTRDGVEIFATPSSRRGLNRSHAWRGARSSPDDDAVNDAASLHPRATGRDRTRLRAPLRRERSNDARGACSCAPSHPPRPISAVTTDARRTRARRYRSDRRLDPASCRLRPHTRSATRSPSALSGAPRVVACATARPAPKSPKTAAHEDGDARRGGSVISGRARRTDDES